MISFAEFPLVLLLQVIPGGSTILYTSVAAYIAFFSVVGSIMYATVGAGLGALINRLARAKAGAGGL